MSEASFLVIGGEGFLGSTLVKALVAAHPTASVASLDIVQRHFTEKAAWTFYSADLTNLQDLVKVITQSGATTVFHTARPSFLTCSGSLLLTAFTTGFTLDRLR
ncbi:hypothetical protein P7C70_g9201, partial [Phenoliferia sp. Uapishka_3]